MVDICKVVDCLHSNNIILTELDPTLILVDDQNLELQTLLIPPYFSVSPPLLKSWIDDNSPIKTIPLLNDYKLHDILMRLALDKENIERWSYTSFHPYIAPECISSEITNQTDIFSLGILLYWLFSDHPSFYEPIDRPFKEKLFPKTTFAELQLITIVESIYFEKLLGLDIHWRGNVPEEVIPLIQKATSGKQQDRHKDVSAFLNDLLAIPTNTLKVLINDEAGNSLSNMQMVVEKQTQGTFSDTEKFTGHSDENGIFEVTDLLQGEYVVRVVDKDKKFKTYQTKVEILEDTEFELTLKRVPLGKQIKQLWNKITG